MIINTCVNTINNTNAERLSCVWIVYGRTRL